MMYPNQMPMNMGQYGMGGFPMQQQPQQFLNVGQYQYPNNMGGMGAQFPQQSQFPQQAMPGVVGMNPTMVAMMNMQQQQLNNQYQYPTVNGNGVFPATNAGMNPVQQQPSMNVGGIYLGDNNPAPGSGMAAYASGGQQQSTTVPNGAAYPSWFQQLTNVPPNQMEQYLRQALNRDFTKLLEKVSNSAFAKFVTPNGIDTQVVQQMLTESRRVAQLILLFKARPSMVEAVNYAIEIVLYGVLVREIGGVNSPTFNNYEMITSVNLRNAAHEYSEMIGNPNAYQQAIGKFQLQVNQNQAVTPQQQQNIPSFRANATVQKPVQPLASIVVDTSDSMIDPLDVKAQREWDEKLARHEQMQEANRLKQGIAMNNPNHNPADAWNLGLEDPAPVEPVVEVAPIQQVPKKLYTEHLTVVGLNYNLGKPRMTQVKLANGMEIQGLFEPQPLDPHDWPLICAAQDEYKTDMCVYYDSKIAELQAKEETDRQNAHAEAVKAAQAKQQARIQQSQQTQPQTEQERHVLQQAAPARNPQTGQIIEQVAPDAIDRSEAMELYQETLNNPNYARNEQTPAQQPAVHQQVAPAVQANSDVPPKPAVSNPQVNQSQTEAQIFEQQAATGQAIHTSPNGKVIHTASAMNEQPWMKNPPPENYYGGNSSYFGQGESLGNATAPETDAEGNLLNQSEDAFNQLVHEQEALEAAQIEAMSQAHGNPQSLDAIIDQAKAAGVEFKSPELRVDYLQMEPHSRKRVCRDIKLRQVPAYIKRKYNLTMVSNDDKREVVLEKVDNLDYLKHETEFHQVKKFDTWDTSDATERFVKHIQKSAANTWSEDSFVNQLNERLAEISGTAEGDQELSKILAEQPLVEIEDLLTNTGSSDDYQSEVVAELNSREVDDVGIIVENSIISYTRFTTSRVVVTGEDYNLFNAVNDARTATDVITAIRVLKQNTSIPTREVARLLSVFTKRVNVKLAVIFANGWAVTDPLNDYSELLDLLVEKYPNMSVADVQSTLTAIYADAVKAAFFMITDETRVDVTGIVGNVESVTLLPYFYNTYPLAKADDVGYISPEHFPELIGLLSKVTNNMSIIKLVTLDNVVMSFTTGGENEYFLTAIEE